MQVNLLTSEDLRALNAKLDTLTALVSTIREHVQPKGLDPDLMTRREVAETLGIGLSTVDQWANRGLLRKYRIGGKVYFKRSEVLAMDGQRYQRKRKD